jgi:hypothetical protein
MHLHVRHELLGLNLRVQQTGTGDKIVSPTVAPRTMTRASFTRCNNAIIASLSPQALCQNCRSKVVHDHAL